MKLTESHKRFITGMLIATGFWLIFFYCSPLAFSTILVAILLTILCREWVKIFNPKSYKFWLIMPIYPILPFALLIYMNHHESYRVIVYYLFLTVFSFDTSAYIAGSIIGKHKIIPSISPNKTFEGFIAGYIGALVIFYAAIWEDGIDLSHTTTLLLVLLISTSAFLGDIFESYLKRYAKLKDSGKILPGHGGFLDRFDAVMSAAIIMFLLRSQLSRLLT